MNTIQPRKAKARLFIDVHQRRILPRRTSILRSPTGEQTVLRDLKAQQLRPECIAQAYPLIQAALPKVPLEVWVAFARTLVEQRDRPKTGIISIVSEQGYIAGLSSYRVHQSLTHGQSLTADHFIALDMFDRQAVVYALAEAVEALAREHQCGAIHMNLLEKDGARVMDETASTLLSRGHRVEAVRLCKILPQPGESKC